MLGVAYHPDRPPETWDGSYARAMLLRYKATWLSAWTMYSEAEDKQEGLEKVVRCTKRDWPKFLEDLKHHRANQRASVGYAEGLKGQAVDEGTILEEPAAAAVWCGICEKDTLDPRGEVFASPVSGLRTCDKCADCDGKPRTPAAHLVTEDERAKMKAALYQQLEDYKAKKAADAAQVTADRESKIRTFTGR